VQSTVQQTVDEKLVRALPLSGRNFLHLGSLAAGFTGNPSFPGVNGQNYFTNNVMVDGASHFSKWRSAARTYHSGYGLESVKEVQVLTNRFSAEFGETLSAVTSAVTKSGTNQLSGSALIFAQDDSLNARPPFATRVAPLSFQQYGFTLGGPIVKDRTHFFTSYEGRRQRSNNVVTSPAARGEVVPNDQNEHLLFAKIDHQVGSRHLLTARYNGQFFDWHNEAGGLSLPGVGDEYSNTVHTLFFMDTFQVSSRLLNETRVQFARYVDVRQDLQKSVYVSRSGYSTEGAYYGAPGFGADPEDTWEASNTFTYWQGAHQIKFGLGAKHVRAVNPQLFYGEGGYFYAGAPDLYPQPFQFTQAFAINPGSEFVEPRSMSGFVFVQDDWKVLPRLTLNLGLRYDIEKPYNIRNYEAPVDANNLQPRVGFTWDPQGNGKSAVRGGVGLYVQQHLFYHLNRAQLEGADGTVTLTIPAGSDLFPAYPNVLPAFPAGATLPARNIREIVDDLKNPYSVQGTLGAERALPGNWLLGVDYVYLSGHDLYGTIDANAPSSVAPDVIRSVAAADATRPITPAPNGFRNILTLTNLGRSWYHGLQVKAQRSTGPIRTMVSYTLSQAEDMVDAWNPPLDSNDIESDRAVSNHHQRHNFVAALSLDLPGSGPIISGWSLSGVATLRDGRPYTRTFGDDRTGTTLRNARPGARNTERTEGYKNVDIALAKIFRVGGLAIETRAEAFNAFNTLNYNTYSGALSAATFGQPISAFEKRRLQLAAIVRF
jgi:outer membrane receptor protein involved in Fe transport